MCGIGLESIKKFRGQYIYFLTQAQEQTTSAGMRERVAHRAMCVLRPAWNTSPAGGRDPERKPKKRGNLYPVPGIRESN